MSMFTKFFDSAAGVLAGHNEDHEHVRARAEQLLMQMNSGDVEARKYIESRHNDQSWEFYAVIVLHHGEYDLRDPGNRWRSSGSMDLDIPGSCTLPSNFGKLTN